MEELQRVYNDICAKQQKSFCKYSYNKKHCFIQDLEDVWFQYYFFIIFLLPLLLQAPPVAQQVHTQWPRWETPWGLGMVSPSGCLKVEQDSCTADRAELVTAALTVHGFHTARRPQRRARGLRGKETWWLFTKNNNHCSIRWKPGQKGS